MPLLSNGDRIRELRLRKAWKLGDLAQRMGTTANYLTKVELGHVNGGPEFVRRAAEALGVEVAEITTYVAEQSRAVAS